MADILAQTYNERRYTHPPPTPAHEPEKHTHTTTQAVFLDCEHVMIRSISYRLSVLETFIFVLVNGERRSCKTV